MPFASVETLPIQSLPGAQLFSQEVDGGTLYLVTSRDPAGNNLATSLTFAQSDTEGTPQAVLNTLNATTGSLPAGAITGAGNVTLISSNATPGAQLVRTAAQMLADQPGGAVGQSWNFRICNSGAGTLTLTTDAGATVTLTGTMTVATATWRDFVAKFTSATTATITAVGNGTFT